MQPGLPLHKDGVVLLAAVTAEVHGIQALFVGARQVLLRVDRQRAQAGRVERGVGTAGAGNELVQLECEEAALAVVAAGGPVLFGQRRDQQELAQDVGAGQVGQPGIGGQHSGGVTQGLRLGAYPPRGF